MISLFPFDNIREPQKHFMETVYKAISEKKHCIVSAPTGVGKTAAALVPAVKHLLEKKVKRIIFLTTRHTQHRIAIETISRINEKNNISLKIGDIIGKRWMCSQPNADKMRSSDFFEFCKSLRKSDRCEFYMNTRKNSGFTNNAKMVVSQLEKTFSNVERIREFSSELRLCPYEIAIEIIRGADVIICDYQYIFNAGIKAGFLKKSGISLSESVIIVDEAHNLPKRLRDILSARVTTRIIKRSILQAKRYKENEVIPHLVKVQDAMNFLSHNIENEKKVKKQDFLNLLWESQDDYDNVVSEMSDAGERVSEQSRNSYLSSVARFLEFWPKEDAGFVRYIKNEPDNTTLFYNCLDPGLLMGEVISETNSFVLMSATLFPLEMYRDILGFKRDNCYLESYKSPFPEKNRLIQVIPRTTSTFRERNEQQYKSIAKICSDIIASCKGNIALFFPSYAFRNNVLQFIQTEKEILAENKALSREEKDELLKRFKALSNKGAVLLAAASGSFSEGIDLPGDYLKGVVIVGLPLEKPDTEIIELIDYYEKKFGKGRLYGYVYPAMIRSIQAAGRCIRSEKDTGIIVFLDERYVWPLYKKCFPEDWNIEIQPRDYAERIKSFFTSLNKKRLPKNS
ncbi:MAG TPA: ATP-dependent DNA helicase [Candidatus Woesearchaeota archaeon]|nr:ATP-dependent DNA helicase [Candidatus Woesearchaeota archaeon]